MMMVPRILTNRESKRTNKRARATSQGTLSGILVLEVGKSSTKTGSFFDTSCKGLSFTGTTSRHFLL